jgi:enoyl-CoA hydratase/carnithine racemase
MNEIKLERQPPILTVVLNRPEKRNAITSAMWQALPTIATKLETDAALRVAILRGAGQAAFSAGADIEEMSVNLRDPAAMQVMQEAVQIAQTAWATVAKPTIALIDGACTGGGCGLALASDIRIATARSYFAVPPAKLGLVYSLSDTARLVAAVGTAFAKEMLFTGRRVAAEEALKIGLVNAIVPSDELDARGHALATQIAQSAPTTVAAAKRIINLIAAGQTSESAETQALYTGSFASADFLEGASAFVEKRTPKF